MTTELGEKKSNDSARATSNSREALSLSENADIDVESGPRGNDNNDAIGTQLEKTVSAKSAVLSRHTSQKSWIDPGPPPDGGLIAWTQAVMSHLTLFNTFGYISSFGVFQTYYESILDVSPSAISWIGSVQICLLFLIGAFSGRALDAGYFHQVYIAGAILQMLGIFTTSVCKTYWQFFLSQALCTGISNGLQFTPSLSLLSTYFSKHRAIAIGISALGSSTGGVMFPLVVQQLLPKVGFGWTMRVIGFIMLFNNIVTIAFYRTRLPPRKSGPLVDWPAFKELPFTLFCAGMFFIFSGLYFAFFYIGSYGRNNLGLSYQDSINLLIVPVAMGLLFRLLPNYFADKVGSLNSLIPFAFLVSVMLFVWISIHDRTSLYVFAAFYGIGAAGIQSLYPAVLSSLNTDLSKAGARMGMGFSIVGVASLVGPPVAGALIQRGGGDYLYAQIWGGTSFFVGAVLLVATRTAKVGWNWKRFV